MQEMKRIIIMAIASLALMSCSLKEQVTSHTRPSLYYTDYNKLRTGLNGCYTPLRTIYSSLGFWQMTECGTDLMYLGSSTQYNAICAITPASPGCGTTVWKYAYQGVSRANTIIAATENVYAGGGVSDREYAELMAETAVLRAFHYYLLTSTFGDVPFYTEEVTEHNKDSIAYLPRMSAHKTRDYLIDELLKWLLPVSEGGREALELRRTYAEGTDYRAGAAVGLMLAGRMALWNGRWADAVKAFGVLESRIYGDLSQYPLTDVPFSRKYTPESIWELPNTYEEYGFRVTSSLAQWMMPTRSKKNVVAGDEGDVEIEDEVSDIYNGMSIPELGSESRIYGGVWPTSYYYRQILPYTSEDKRSGEYSNGSNEPRGGSGNLAWRWSGYKYSSSTETLADDRTVNFFSSCGGPTLCPWPGNKFWCYDMKNSLDHNNYKIFRYAGAVLGMAEAYLGLEQYDQACRYLNMTRTRAGLKAISMDDMGGNKGVLMEEIRCEYARELLGEFTRKFDLVRWGIWYEKVLDCNANSTLLSHIQPYHRYWPIPAEQVAESGGNLHNDEYGE